MFLAHHFPGLSLSPERMDALSPEDSAALIGAGQKVLKHKAEERWSHTKILAMASGARIR
jgi:hypothetical protein